MASKFDLILRSGTQRGLTPAKTVEARDWFRERAQTAGRRASALAEIKNKRDWVTSGISIGKMYLFQYEAKHKATLPYWDMFPLVFPFAAEGSTFTGINVHYLPLPYRARLMDALYDTVNNNRFNESTRLNISYSILSGAAKFNYFKPTVHKYLNSNVRSRLLEIPIDYWDIALFLPFHKFQNKSTNKVWSDSRKTIAG